MGPTNERSYDDHATCMHHQGTIQLSKVKNVGVGGVGVVVVLVLVVLDVLFLTCC